MTVSIDCEFCDLWNFEIFGNFWSRLWCLCWIFGCLTFSILCDFLSWYIFTFTCIWLSLCRWRLFLPPNDDTTAMAFSIQTNWIWILTWFYRTSPAYDCDYDFILIFIWELSLYTSSHNPRTKLLIFVICFLWKCLLEILKLDRSTNFDKNTNANKLLLSVEISVKCYFN